MATIRELLAKVDLFALLPPAEQALVAAEAVPRAVEAGAVLCREGDAGRTFFVVATGEVLVQVGAPAVDVARLGPGEYFGEMSVLSGDPRSATVSATKSTFLLEFDRPTIYRLFGAHVELAQTLSEILASRKRKLDEIRREVRLRPHEEEARDIRSRLRSFFGLD